MTRHDASSERPRLGVLYPGHAAEDDYPEIAGRVESRPVVDVVHTSVGEDAHRVDALLDLGGPTRLAEGAARLAGRVDSVIWACTSGSFVFGLSGARDQVAGVRRRTGVPASSTSLGFVSALRALGATRPAIAATYPDDVVAAFVDFLGEAGVEAVAASGQDIVTAAEVGTLGRDRVVSFVTAGDHPDADAVLVPDTALHTVRWLDDLEAALGKPVVTANQVTVWEALRLVGANRAQPGLGALFAV
jgi:maleate cis-trans isomerase